MRVKRATKKIQFPLRVEPWLHKALRVAADRNGCSWNGEANRRLRESLDKDSAVFTADRLMEMVEKRVSELVEKKISEVRYPGAPGYPFVP